MSEHAASPDPIVVADLVLGLAVRTDRPIYIEPVGESYGLRVETRPRAIDVMIPAALARATIARLAFIADLDVAATRTASAAVATRCGPREREVMVTLRPGHALRADIVVLDDSRGRAAVRPGGPYVGDRIGNYEVKRKIGEGGMGTVYQVAHTSLERSYALKVLRANVLERDRDAAPRFLREARLAARIRHPNIVDVFDFGYLADGRPYLVMELFDGESLADSVQRAALPISEVIAIARQLASALAAAHDVGVIHADVTPSNALIVRQSHAVKLVDFGLARLRTDAAGDASDFVFGTPAYISPEQLRGAPASELSDQYGLGAVLFHLIRGEQPYTHDNVRDLCLMHLTAPIPSVSSPYGQLPAGLADLVTRCLQKSPSARFPDMKSLVVAIDDVEGVSNRRDWTRWLGR